VIAVAILAGGLATRIRSVAGNMPKALLPIAGKPFIDHQLARLREQGCQRVVLCVGHLGELIRAHVGDGSKWKLEVQYSFDGPTLLGTGGALRAALPKLGDTFFVLYGDSYLQCDFAAVERAFLASGKPALMTVLRNENRWDSSNVEFAHGVVLKHDKKSRTSDMRYIDYGLSGLSAEALNGFNGSGAFDLSDLFKQLAEQGKLAGYEVHERFYEIGSPAGIAETNQYLMNQARRAEGR
jgi:MurNAc alpha-1-phosphate uridylyltransferase